MPGRKTLAIALIIALLLLVAPVNAASNEAGVHIKKLTVEPNGPDFNLTAQYSTSFMTKIFSLLFGAKVVQPGIVDQLSALGNVTLVSIDTSAQEAKLQAKDQGVLSGGYYFYNKGAEFPATIDQLEINGNAYDLPMTINNAAQIPTFFYKS